MQKYEQYKNSGVEWLGDIPKHWEVKKFKFILNQSKGLTITKRDLVDEGILCVNYGEIHSKYGFKLDTAKNKLKCVDEKHLVTDPNSILNKGDFVFADTSEDIQGSGNFTHLMSDDKTFAGYHTVIARPKVEISSLFFAFLFDSIAFRNQIRKIVKGVKVYSITQSVLKETNVWIPSIKEQTAIANFLYDKIVKIDQAISIKQKQIELLKERRQILIHKAVTRGLNENVKLKDSGVEWIGEIPERWEIKRFRYVFKLGKGLTITKENLTDEGVFCVNYGEIHSKFGFEVNPAIHKLKCVHPDYLIKNSSSLINNGDFVFADTSEDIKGSGNFTYLNSKEQVFAGYHTVIARPNKDIISRFIAYEFDSLVFKSQIHTKVKGVKVYSITQSILKELSILLPPKNEQLEIVNYLDNATSKIATAISLKEQEIEKLREYKMSLIDAVVTGKLKVS
jgi:type I restriction enzyme S subunit